MRAVCLIGGQETRNVFIRDVLGMEATKMQGEEQINEAFEKFEEV